LLPTLASGSAANIQAPRKINLPWLGGTNAVKTWGFSRPGRCSARLS
jgi:hypothetical protein